jgi:hypothetical protein
MEASYAEEVRITQYGRLAQPRSQSFPSRLSHIHFSKSDAFSLCLQREGNERECTTAHQAVPLSCIITGGPAPILRSVNEVKPKTWRILTFADAISMTTGPKFPRNYH